MIGESAAFSVTDFVATFNQTLEYAYPEVIIRGELANFRVSKNAWVYFDLKDDFSTLKFFGSVRCLPGPLEDGMLLEVVGRPYLHQQYGFSVQISSVQPVGSGSINKAHEMLLKKFEAQGFFDQSRKRTLPYPPNKIALIASKESAAYGDFMAISQTRWPGLDIILFDVQVQGREAPKQIVSAINDANQNYSDIDVLVVVRGGGSKDDLSAFDVESVALALATSRVPTLAAIGHERDVAISELVADVRASTPSNAAEILVPNIAEERLAIKQLTEYLDEILRRYLAEIKQVADHYSVSVHHSLQLKLQALCNDYVFMGRLLDGLDPSLPLERGYAIIRNQKGALVRSVGSVQDKEAIVLQLRDGSIGASIQEIREKQ